jgi:outer membrane protein, heavy metal efflux system
MFRFFLLVLAVSTCSFGQDRLTIEQAVTMALDKNLSLLAERYNVPVADAKIITAGLRPNPVFSAGLDYQDILGTGFNDTNGAGPSEFNVRTDFTLEGGGKRHRRVEVAQAARSVTQLQLLNATRQVVFDVQSAFIDVQLAKENVALAEANAKAWSAIVEVNSARVKAGDLAQVELLRTRLAALQSQNLVRQAELRLHTASNRLQLLLGHMAASLDVAGPLRRDQQPILLDDVRDLALKLRPDLEAQRRDQLRAQAEIDLQLANAKIDYTVGTQYHRQYDNAKGNAMGFFFSVPLPVFNRNQGEIERARQERRQVEARTKALEASIRNEIDTAYQQYLTARGLLENIEKDMLGQARQVREITEYSYRRGEASLIELLDAQRAFNDTMQSYNEARAEFARSLFLIDSTSGKTVHP